MKFRENDYYQYINDIARDAAKERVKFMLNDLKVNPADDDEDKIYRAYVKSLIKKYPYQDSDEFFKRFNTLKNTPSSTIASWLMGGNGYNDEYDPTKVADKAELEKLLPLIAGIAKPGKDWLSTNGEALRDKAASKEFGYSREEFPEFLDKLRQYQTDYDRAKLLQQAKEEMPLYNLRKLVTPSAFQEFENAVATGGDYDGSTAAKFGALDAGANAAMVMAPSARVVKNPLVNGAIDALMQSAFEAGRQGVKQGLSTTGQEFDMAPVVFAGSSGATKPAIIGTTQGVVTRIGNPTANEFARGMSKAFRTGDPVYTERTALEKAIERYNNNLAWWQNKLYKTEEEKSKELALDLFGKATKDRFGPLARVEGDIALSKVPRQAEILGVSPTSEGLFDTAKILEAYDQPLGAVERIGSKQVKIAPRDAVSEWVGKNNAGPKYRVLYAKDADEFRNLFPAKYTDEASETGASKAGRIAGEVLAGIGSRVEPTFKIAGTKLGLPERTYKDEQWYKKLKPTAKKIIDAALKKKEEEEE